MVSENTTPRVPFFRRILLVNKRVQMRLIGYGAFAGIVCGYFAAALQLHWAQLDRDGLYLYIGGGFCVVALVVFLGMIVSSQIAGPIYRLHRNIRKIADGERPEKILIRRGDAYGELFADYNRMLDRMEGRSRDGKQ